MKKIIVFVLIVMFSAGVYAQMGYFNNKPERIVEVYLNEKENQIEVLSVKGTGAVTLMVGNNYEKHIAYKYIFGVVEGRIKLIKTIIGNYIPKRYEQKEIPESFHFNEEK